MPPTPTASWPRTSHDPWVSQPPASHLAHGRNRSRARRRLRAHGGGDRPRLRRPPAHQLRLRATDHGRRLCPCLRRALELCDVGVDSVLLRCRAGAVDPDGPTRLPAAAHELSNRDARGDVRRRVPPPEHRVAEVRPAVEERRPARAAQRALGHLRRADQGDCGDCGRHRGGLPRHPPAVAHSDAARAAHAGRGHGLPDRAAAGRPGEPRDRGGRDHLGAARRHLCGVLERAGEQHFVHVRPSGHGHRPRGGGGRRDEPADPGDARRLLDRLRHRDPRRRAPSGQDPVPDELHLRGSDRGAARAAERALHSRRGRGGARMNLVRRLPEVLVPALLVLATALLGLAVSSYLEAYFVNTLIKVAIVVGLYVFIGNSGVLSFGQISFVAVGAWTAGVLTVPRADKPIAMPGLAHFLVTTNVGNIASLALAAAIGGAFAFAVGLPLMRLSGLAAGIATFAVLEITNNVLNYEGLISPALNGFSSVPATTGIWQATIGCLICIAVAYAYQRTRFGRMLRATREDPAAAAAAGISIHRQRLVAFTLAGALAGFAGGLYVHLQPLAANDLFLDLTFITLAMLVVGGSGSLLGAVVGALVVNGIYTFFHAAVNTVDVFGWHLHVQAGTAEVVLGVVMVVVLILRPNGITGSREFSLPRRRRPVADLEKARATT